MKHPKITVLSISDPTGTHAPSAGFEGELGRLALESEVKNLSASLQSQIHDLSAAAAMETFTSLTDTPSAYAGSEGDLVQVNDAGTKLQFINFASGTINCDTINDVYTISHSKIKSTSNPIVTIVVPDVSSELVIPSVTNIVDGAFTVILSDTPEVDGYKINWLLL